MVSRLEYVFKDSLSLLEMKDSTFNFNKQLIFGEIGSVIFAPLTSLFVSQFTKNSTTISASAVVGALFGAPLFWIVTRIYDNRKKDRKIIKKLAGDIAYFTPVAFLVAILVYQPTLFIISRYLLDHEGYVILSVIGSQVIAYSLFVIIINIYRSLLYRFHGKEL